MSTNPLPETTIVCQFCSHGNELFVFNIDPRATKTRCPSCKRSYGLLTRLVAEARARVDRNGRRFYDYVTREPDGRTRLRSAAVSGRVEIRPGRWYTFVSRGDRLMGVADQSQGYWLPVPHQERTTGSDKLWRLLTWACLLLAVAQGLRLLGFAQQTISTSPASLLALLILAVLLAAPLAQWALSVAADEEEEDEEIDDPFAP
jgi:hypothetical protein